MRKHGGWLEDVRDALIALGGKAHLSKIYKKVLEVRRQRGDPIGKYQAWIRYYLQQNSRGRGQDIFEHVEPPRSGQWRLKSG